MTGFVIQGHKLHVKYIFKYKTIFYNIFNCDNIITIFFVNTYRKITVISSN